MDHHLGTTIKQGGTNAKSDSDLTTVVLCGILGAHRGKGGNEANAQLWREIALASLALAFESLTLS